MGLIPAGYSFQYQGVPPKRRGGFILASETCRFFSPYLVRMKGSRFCLSLVTWNAETAGLPPGEGGGPSTSMLLLLRRASRWGFGGSFGGVNFLKLPLGTLRGKV